MDIHITEEAVAWYKEAYDEGTETLRFFVRYGGFGGNVPGFSLGVMPEKPFEVHASTKVNNLTLFIEEADAWYFDNKDLYISLNEEKTEPQFAYQ